MISTRASRSTLLGCILLALAPALAAQGDGSLLRTPELSPAEESQRRTAIALAAQRGYESVAHVFLEFGNGSRSAVKVERPTSGVLVDARGLVVTNRHLVAELRTAKGTRNAEYRLRVQLANGRTYDAEVLAEDAHADLALVQLDLPKGTTVPALELADRRMPRPGESVVVIGRPDGTSRYAFAGVLMHASGSVRLRGEELAADDVLLSDAAMLAETDGGPMLGADGCVLGISNPSHVLPPKSEPTEDDLAQADYAIAISAKTIRRVFAKQLGNMPSKPAALDEAAFAQAGLAANAAGAVVRVTTSTAIAEHPDLEDPYARRAIRGLGSGFVVDPKGLVLAHASVVGPEGSTAFVTMASGQRYEGRVLARHHGLFANAALVELTLPGGTHLPSLELGDSRTIHPGEPIVLLGRPYAASLTISAGVASAVGRDGRLSVAARVHKGLAGGAVLDANGRVVGIVDVGSHELRGDASVRETGIGYATSIDAVRRWFRDAWKERVDVPGLVEARETTEAEEARRRDAVTTVVERTRASLLNVYVKVAIEKSGGFDPFEDEEQTFRYEGLGSGMIIDESGLALTNWHVVDTATQSGGEQREDHALEVSTPDGRRYEANVLSTSRDDDLALLQLTLRPGETLKPVALGDSDALLEGETVIAVGNPYGQANTVTQGVVAAKERDTRIKRRVKLFRGLLQTDAAINPGNSGGALLDLNGRLVGINSAGNSWSGGEGYAIPVNRVRDVFREKLLSAERLRSVYVGINVQDEGGALVVQHVHPNGPAERAGLRRDDRLVRIGKDRVANSVDYAQVLLRLRSDGPTTFEVQRDGKTLSLEVQPIGHTTWTVYRQTGLELAPVDYQKEAARVQAASLALHRSYTGDDRAEPRSLMSGALKVVRVDPTDRANGLEAEPGDWLLGLLLVTEDDLGAESSALVRIESLDDLRSAIGPLATREGTEVKAYVYRGSKILTVTLRCRRG